MFAVNALKHGWLGDVKLFIFGPDEEFLLSEAPMQGMLKEYQGMEETAVACRFIA